MANKPVMAGGRPVSPRKKESGDIRGMAVTRNKPATRDAHSNMPRSTPLTAALKKKLAEHPAQAGLIREIQMKKDRNS